jgi:hydrogenase maturation factor HypF (carbamoyltransferase family)
MTSANLSEEPIAIDNDEALARLGQIADAFLMHDREILQRCDDSVMALVDGAPQLIRRARGFVPLAVPLPSLRVAAAAGRRRASEERLRLWHAADLSTRASTWATSKT